MSFGERAKRGRFAYGWFNQRVSGFSLVLDRLSYACCILAHPVLVRIESLDQFSKQISFDNPGLHRNLSGSFEDEGFMLIQDA